MPLSHPPRAAGIARSAERWLGWCLGLGLLLLALAQLPSFFWQGEVVPKLIVLTVMVALLLLLLGLALLGPRTGALRISWYTLAGVAFVLWSGITAATGTSPRGSLFGMVFRYEGVLGFAAYLVVFLAARWLASSRFMPGRLFVVAGAVVVGLVGLLGLLQHVWPADHPVSSLSLVSFSRSQASFSNPTVLALFGCTVLPVLLVLVREESRSWLQTVLVLAASLIAAGAFLSYSRSFWLAAPIGCALALVLAGPPRRARWGSAIPVVVLAGLFIVAAMQVGQAGPAPDGQAAGGVTLSGRVGETLSGGGSIRSRLELYRGALTLIAEKPVLGRGFETYVPEGARVRSERLVRIEGPFAYADRPHNSLLYIAYATGLPGLVLYLLFVGGAFVAAIRGYRSRSGADKVLAAGLLGGLVAYFLAEQTLFSTIEVTPLFFAMLGWATASASVEAPQSEGERVAASSWAEGIRVPPQYVRVLAGPGDGGRLGLGIRGVPPRRGRGGGGSRALSAELAAPGHRAVRGVGATGVGGCTARPLHPVLLEHRRAAAGVGSRPVPAARAAGTSPAGARGGADVPPRQPDPDGLAVQCARPDGETVCKRSPSSCPISRWTSTRRMPTTTWRSPTWT